MPLKLFSGSLCQMIPALYWQRNFATLEAVTAPEPLLPPSPHSREQWTAYRRPFNRRHIFHGADGGRQVWVNTTLVRECCWPGYRLVVNTIRCPAGIMLISSNTACKHPQVFLSFRKLKSNTKDWP